MQISQNVNNDVTGIFTSSMLCPLYKESAGKLSYYIFLRARLFPATMNSSSWPAILDFVEVERRLWLSFVMIDGSNSLSSHLDSSHLINMCRSGYETMFFVAQTSTYYKNLLLHEHGEW